MIFCSTIKLSKHPPSPTLIVVLVNASPASSGPVCPRSLDLPIPTITSGYLLKSSSLETIVVLLTSGYSDASQRKIRSACAHRWYNKHRSKRWKTHTSFNLLCPMFQCRPCIGNIFHNYRYLAFPISTSLPFLDSNNGQPTDSLIVVMIKLVYRRGCLLPCCI